MIDIKKQIAEMDTSREKLRDFGVLFAIAIPVFALAGWLIHYRVDTGWHFPVILGALVTIIVLNLFAFKFRCVAGVLFSIGVGWSALQSPEISVIYPAVAIVMLGLGLFLPKFLAPLYRLWMILAICLGFIVSRVILCVLFYFVITPISWIAKLTGNKFLQTEFRAKEPSYWIRREKKEDEKAHFENQF